MPKKIDRTGETCTNNYGSKMKIINYRNKDDISVLFEEQNYIKNNVKYRAFILGNVKSPYDKSVYGVGFIGEGKYSHKEHPKIYNTWSNMIQRCYSSDFHKKQSSYLECEVCKKWHNFQLFAEWYEDNIYDFNGELELDKDVLNKNNKIYSPDTCVFVPKDINMLLVKANTIRGEYPIGVSLYRGKRFKASITINNKSIHLGYFNSSLLAHEAYKKAKKEYIHSKADEYYRIIPDKLYNALKQYDVEIND